MTTPLKPADAGPRVSAELPTDVLEAMLGERAGDLKTIPDARRRSPRLPVRLRGTLTPLEGKQLGSPLAVRIKDVSLHGVGVLVRRKFANGAFFLLQVVTDPKTPFLWFRSMRCQSAGPNQFLIGAEFVHVMERGHPVPKADAAPSAAPANDSAELARIRNAILD